MLPDSVVVRVVFRSGYETGKKHQVVRAPEAGGNDVPVGLVMRD